MGTKEIQNEAIYTLFLIAAGQNIVSNAVKYPTKNIMTLMQIGLLFILAGVWQAQDMMKRARVRTDGGVS